MNVQEAYNNWAIQYDSNLNKTRDVEGIALREKLANIPFSSCLEIGCGTGKNTIWLITKAQQVIAVDLSEEMLSKARTKTTSHKVKFVQADINESWTFAEMKFDLIGFSLVLEHIDDIDNIFKKAAAVVNPGGYIYIGELHPFKQYSGTKARFDTESGQQIVPCFNHHISEFIQAGRKYGFDISDLDEYFDDGDKQAIPRILTILLKKA